MWRELGAADLFLYITARMSLLFNPLLGRRNTAGLFRARTSLSAFVFHWYSSVQGTPAEQLSWHSDCFWSWLWVLFW